MNVQEKVMENRFRRVLLRRGCRLMKSHRRDVNAVDSGYIVIDDYTREIISGGEPHVFSLSLNDVKNYIQQRWGDRFISFR